MIGCYARLSREISYHIRILKQIVTFCASKMMPDPGGGI
jgi:hypothetical protein